MWPYEPFADAKKMQKDCIDILEEKVAALEKQVAELTADRDRFLQALVGAAEMALNNNVTAAMMPKDMRRVLTEYVKNSNGKTTQKANV